MSKIFTEHSAACWTWRSLRTDCRLTCPRHLRCIVCAHEFRCLWQVQSQSQYTPREQSSAT